jgi:hypothetical protein
MDRLEQKLYDYMLQKDVPPEIAKPAAEECARRFQRNVLLGAGAGIAVGALSRNPGTILMGVVVGGFSGTATLIGSPSCQQVRDAAFKLTGL